MGEYRLTDPASRQIVEIFAYGIVTFGPQQARRYQDELGKVFQLLADNPRLGRSAEKLTGGFRRHEHGEHVILYREEDGGILVAGVFHMSSDWQLPPTD